MNRDLFGAESTFDGRFVAYFGVSARVVDYAWLLMLDYDDLPEELLPIHLLDFDAFLSTMCEMSAEHYRLQTLPVTNGYGCYCLRLLQYGYHRDL